MKHAEHPMNKEDATGIMNNIAKAQKPGMQVDPSSAHMTDREQWRYYQGRMRALSELTFDMQQLQPDALDAVVKSKITMLEEIINHVELRIEAKRNGIDYAHDSH